ncbi:MAG: cytidylyltransferase domain-containing protein [Bacteroidota bacterium]
MKILSIIPARSGSRGVPGKNTKLLGGKPLIAYTIESAKQSKWLTDIVVSTDSESIATLAREHGAVVPFIRPAELATDSAKSIDVVVHTLTELQNQNKLYDAVVLLQPTNPFRPAGFIDEAIERFSKTTCDALVSVLPVPHEYNPHWVFEPDANGYLHIATGDTTIIPRRQELPKAYFRDGSIYITRTDVLLSQKSFFGKTLSYIEANPALHVNIDTLEDWERAEQLIKIVF